MGRKIAGRRFATLIFVIPSMLKDNPIIRRLPIAVILYITLSIKNPFKYTAQRVIRP